jgi:putative transposase
MKKSRFSDEQISSALRQVETGTKVQDICRQLGISQATFFNWKSKFGGMGVNEPHRLRQLEQENAHLLNLVRRSPDTILKILND